MCFFVETWKVTWKDKGLAEKPPEFYRVVKGGMSKLFWYNATKWHQKGRRKKNVKARYNMQNSSKGIL